MTPTLDQISKSAYDRWERRGRAHGHDRSDWLAAERQARFASNYRVLVSYCLDDGAAPPIGDRHRRRCRFCSQAPPRASFTEGVPVVPGGLGSSPPVAYDQCDECVSEFAGGIDRDLARFLDLDVPGGRSGAGTPGISAGAFKGLVKLAMAVMPGRDLEDHEDALEWVANPDHGFDFNVFRGLSCAVHVAPNPYPGSWVALASRTDDREPWPARLFFLGVRHLAYLVPIPLNPSDEDLDISAEVLPDVLPPSPFGPEHDPIARFVLPISSGAEAREPANR